MAIARPGATIVSPDPNSHNEPPINQSALEARRKLRLIVSFLLVLVTLALYNPINRAPYLNYDDNAYVYENYHVREGLNRGTIVWAFTTNAESNWHPLTWLSHSLDVTLFGLNPAGPHYVNVLLHAANVVLLFLLLEGGTGMAWRSFAVAALFAVHPLNVESVAWISERKNVLSMFFFLLTLTAYGRYVRKPGVARYALVALCFALGLMAKPQVITLPFALLLLDYWPLRRTDDVQTGDAKSGEGKLRAERSWGQLIAEKLPLLGLSAASAWMTMKAQSTAMHLEFPLTVRLENAFLAYVKYIAKTLWPVDLAPLYPHPGFTVNAGYAAAAALAVIAITLLAALSQRRYLLVGWLWFLGIMVPMAGLVQVGVQAMADRYAYIPIIGLLVIICWGSANLLEKWHVPRFSGSVAAGFAVIALAFASHRYLDYWKDNLALWTHTLQVTRNNYIAEDSVGDALIKQGRIDEAAVHFQNAVSINPQDPIGNLNLGVFEQQKQNYGAAIAHFETVPRLTQNPRLLALAFTNLGYAYYTAGKYDSARKSFNSALDQQQENSQAFLGLGVIAYGSGDYSQAVDEYEKALRLQASDLGYLLLAQALEKEGRAESARAARAAAERISRNIDTANVEVQRLLTH
jgi:protein O-mannosyl-transferase